MFKKSPLSLSVAHSIRQQILEGKLANGRALPSERAIAEEHAVSRTIVRDAIALLNSEGLVSIKDRCRPTVSAAVQLRSVNTDVAQVLGLWLWPYSDNFIGSSLLRGVQKAIHGTHFRLGVGSPSVTEGDWNSVVECEARFLEEVINDPHSVGAIIWYLGGPKNLDLLSEARKRGLRFVFVDRKPPAGFDSDFTGTDNRSAAQVAVNHLFYLGHQRIALVLNADLVSSVTDRRLGFIRAMVDGGIDEPENLILQFLPNAQQSLNEVADSVLDELLAKRATAAFCVNDTVALLLRDACERRGIEIPKDLSIIGFDGLLRWLPDAGKLTTMHQDFTRMGEIAGELLIERMNEPQFHGYRHVLIDSQLSVNGSTAKLQ